jgi:hypothetical protein
MTIQPHLHSSVATAGNPATVVVLGRTKELGVEAPAFEDFLPPAKSSTQSTLHSESSLGENVPVFNERLTHARPTRWYGIND